MNIFELMAAPFVECLVLIAIHTYLGLHVLKRRVIFVDLALAQTAALGTTVGFLFGIMPETPGALLFSLLFAFLGAAVFSITRFRHERVPQEAIIGLTYAVTCALAVLVVEKTQGAEHLKDILVGNLLWVTWKDVGLAAAAYSALGLFHFVFRKKFLLISEDPDAAYRAGIRVRAWDFLFYMTFGVVITLSTRVAGVLMVFVFLVAPAILAFLITTRLSHQLLIGWGMGTLVTVSGLYLSWAADLPSGPAVIAFYGAALILGGVVVYLVRAKPRLAAVRNVGLGILAVVLVALGVWGAGRGLATSSIAVSDEARAVEQSIHADEQAASEREQEASSQRQRQILDRATCLGSSQVDRYLTLGTPEEALTRIREKLAAERRAGLELLLAGLADAELPLLYREEGVALLTEVFGEALGYNPEEEPAANLSALNCLCERIRTVP
ncbi:MAG: metal ABC transporter permease [Myxococcota bacterium]|jgi:zinc/manganese transport system permease protein|nr:metal ABC transporter permease [Myxococcota bacterium]